MGSVLPKWIFYPLKSFLTVTINTGIYFNCTAKCSKILLQKQTLIVVFCLDCICEDWHLGRRAAVGIKGWSQSAPCRRTRKDRVAGRGSIYKQYQYFTEIQGGLVMGVPARIIHKQPSQTPDPSRGASNTSTEMQVSNDYGRKITGNCLWSVGNFLGSYKSRTYGILKAGSQFWPRAPGQEGRSFSTERKARHPSVSGVDDGPRRGGNNRQDHSLPHPCTPRCSSPRCDQREWGGGGSCHRLLLEGSLGTPMQGAASWEGPMEASWEPLREQRSQHPTGAGKLAGCTQVQNIASRKCPGKNLCAKGWHLSRQGSLWGPFHLISPSPEPPVPPQCPQKREELLGEKGLKLR